MLVVLVMNDNNLNIKLHCESVIDSRLLQIHAAKLCVTMEVVV